MSISEGDVRHIAALARIGLDARTIPALVDQLNGILGHMDVLQSVVVPANLTRAVASMPMRDDIAAPVVLQRERADFAPEMRDGFFLVPRLATHGAAGATDATMSADEVGHA